MPLPITGIFAGLNTILLLYLSIQVISYRRTKQIAFGDKDDVGLIRRMRAQANAAEYMPISLILLGLTEGMSAPGWAVGLWGAALLCGRVMHGLSFASKDTKVHFRYRVVGMHLTLWPLLAAAAGLIGNGLLQLTY